MVRPRLRRRIFAEPNVTYFKPAGIRMIDLKESILAVDEFEAVRLKDLEGLEQEQCAKKMNISQPTFSRLVEEARKKIADAIINGKAIKIEGGNFKMAMPRGRGFGMGRGFGSGGRMGGFAAGPSGNCVCPKCGYKEQHQLSMPCYQKKCPKCGSPMTRE
jgi:predicted DNA-binding protein (UPF0251 family)